MSTDGGGCRTHPYGPAGKEETLQPLSESLTNLREKIKRRTLAQQPTTHPTHCDDQVSMYENFLKTWVVVGLDLVVERVDGEKIISEDQYDLGFIHVDYPDPGDKVVINERRGCLEVMVPKHAELDWTVLWRDWEESRESRESKVGRTVFGRDVFKESMVITREIWKWNHMNHGCGLVSEYSMLGKWQSLAIKDEFLIWGWSEVNSFQGLTNALGVGDEERCIFVC